MQINPPRATLPSGYAHRRGTKKEFDQIQKVVFNALEEHGLTPNPDSTDFDLSDVESFYKDGYFGVITKDDTIVATFGLLPLDDQTTELRKMYATPNVRGNGLGRWMVNYCVQMTEENGYKTIELETATSLKTAMILYKKMGFVEKTIDNKTPRCDKSFIKKL